MIKNLFFLVCAKIAYANLNIKNLGYYNRSTAYEVISITNCNDQYNLYLYKIKELGTQEIKSFIANTSAYKIDYGKEEIMLYVGYKFCVTSTNRKQGRDFIFEKFVLQ